MPQKEFEKYHEEFHRLYLEGEEQRNKEFGIKKEPKEKGDLIFTTRHDAKLIQMYKDVNTSMFCDTSSRSVYGALLSLFTRGNNLISVPKSDKFSLTVEGIWQGFKIINNQTDETLFDQERVKKRRTQNYSETVFKYGEKVINLVDARRKIFLPSHFYKLDNCVPQQFTDNLIRAHKGGITQYFYDVDDNPFIGDSSSSYSHSDALIRWIKHKLDVEQDLKKIVENSNLDIFKFHLPPRTHHFISGVFEEIEKNPEKSQELYAHINDYLDVSGYETKIPLEDLFEKTKKTTNYNTMKKEILSNLRIYP